MRWRALMTVAFFLLAGRLAGQHYRITHWGIESGLSQGINQKIISDSKGFLWITSYEGLNRFDGSSFRNFYSYPKKRNAIHGVETTGLVEDSLHRIWIGSGDGLNCYDPGADSVSVFYPDQPAAKKARYSIPVVATDKDVICFEVSGKLVAYDMITLRRRVIAGNINWYNDYINVNNAWFDKTTGILWMPVENGVARIDIGTGATTFHLQDEHVNALLFDPDSGLLILGTNDGLISWDPVRGAVIATRNLQEEPLGKVICLSRDRQCSLLIGTEEHGLFIIGPDKMLTHLEKKNTKTLAIGGNKINCIYCDRTGVIWIGVSTNGLDQLTPDNGIMHFSESTGSGLNNNIIRCFIEDDRKNIWIATQGGGVNIFNPAFQQFSSLTRRDHKGLPFDFVRFMVREQRNRALIGTEKGMCRMDMTTFQSEKIGFTGSDHRPLADPYIEQITPFEDSSWLIATKEFGLFQLKGGAHTAVQLAWPGNKHVFYTAFVDHLLFVSVWDEAPKIFTIQKGTWQELQKDLNSFTITYVVHDGLGRKFWIGTLQGLLETDEQLHIVNQFTMDNGLSNHYIYAMVPGKNGMLWISTNKGLSRFDTHTYTFKVFTPDDGLQGYEYNAKSAFTGSDGSLYFGGINGFDVIKDTQAPLLVEPAVFYIKDLLVNNVRMRGDNDINYTKAIYLPHTGNNITIQTGIIDFTTKGNNRIMYKLEGIDTGWKTADRDFVINYSGLSPGIYRFLATTAPVALNAIPAYPTTFTVNIAKPWWQRWTFKIAMLLLGLAFAFLIITSYYRRKLDKQSSLLEKQKAVEAERTRIATDMHDDLGAGLSRIKFLSETITLTSRQEEPIEEALGKIKTYAHEMIDKMGEIVWALNEKNDSLSDLLAYTRSYAVEYLTQHGISYVIRFPDIIPVKFVSGEFRRNVFLSVKEVLHNIVKHAKATEVVVSLNINDKLSFTVHDNGVGILSASARPFSNGLANINTRMGSIGGKVDINDEQGTLVRLTIPLK